MRRLIPVCLMIITLLSLLPLSASAASNVEVIDANNASNPILNDDQQKLINERVFRFGAQLLYISQVSPDDRYVVVQANADEYASPIQLFDITNGERVDLPLPPGFPIFPLIINNLFVWQGPRTLAALINTPDDPAAILARLSLDTGAWELQRLPLPADNVLSLAPNGSRLLLRVRQRDQVVGFQVYDINANRFIDASGIDPERTLQNIAWSPDGSKFAYTVGSLAELDRPVDFRKLDGALLGSQITDDARGQLSPANNPLYQRNELRIFDLDKGSMTVRRAADGDGTTFANLAWSPDNQTLAAVVYYPTLLRGRTYPTYQFPSHSGIRFFNTSLQPTGRFEPGQIVPEIHFATPDELILGMFVANGSYPYYYNRVSGEFRRISNGQGSYSQLLPTNRSRQVLYHYQWFDQPGDLYRLNWDGSALFRISWANEGLRQVAGLRADKISFTLANGDVREGTLIQDASASFPPKNAKIIVYQEGGPFNPMLGGFVGLVEAPWTILPKFGYAILHVPLYGRYGLGPQGFSALADGTNFGQIDIDAQAEIVRQLFTRGWTSRGKVGIVGCSYGGYFTLQSLARHPDLYSAGHSMCSLIDMLTEWNRGYPNAMPFLQPKPATEDPQEYLRDSPFYNARKITTPLLIFHGSEDFLPVTLVENMFATIRQGNPDTRMLKFVGAGHGMIDGPPRLEEPLPFEVSLIYERYGLQQQIRWFNTYLK